jgi:hypothetical protein
MAKKLSDLDALTGLEDDDLLLVTDTSDTTSSVSGTSKKVSASVLASGLLSDVGWLPVTIPTAEEDWTVTGTPSFEDGQVTLADGDYIQAEGLTGAGATLLEQARPMLQRVTLRAQVSDASTANTLTATVNYAQNTYPAPTQVRYDLWETTSDLIAVSPTDNNGIWGYLTADPEEWHTVTWISAPYTTSSVHLGLLGVQINDEWASWNHANATGSTPGTSFNLAYGTPASDTITVDLSQSSLEVKPLW